MKRIPRHIEKIIELEGENEYREERKGEEVRPYDTKERRRRYFRSKKVRSEGDNWEDIESY